MQAARTAPLTTADAMQVLFDRVFGAHEIFFASGEASGASRPPCRHRPDAGRIEG